MHDRPPRHALSETVSPPHGAGRGRMWLWVLIVVIIVACVLIGVLPSGPVKAFSNRQAARLIKDAESWEEESLYRTAAEQYEKVSSNPRIRPDLRTKAAQRLGELQRDFLHNPAAAEAAFEKAYHFATGNARNQLRAELEALRGAPLDPRTSITSTQAQAPAPATPNPTPEARTTTTTLQRGDIAVVGSEHVTVDDILFAWTRRNGGRVPTREELKSFVPQYLDMVLLADEAQRRGLQDAGRAGRDLKLNRLMTLNTAIAQHQVEQLQPPTDATLKAFYTDHPQLFMSIPILKLEIAVIKNATDVDAAAEAVQSRTPFASLAKQFSKGTQTADVNAADPALAVLNDNSGLPARLAHLEAGETTGPLLTRAGAAIFHLVSKQGGGVRPFERAREDVMMAYQSNTLAKQRQQLLNTLRRTSRIQISKTGWERLAGEESQPTTSTAGRTPE